MGPIAKLIGRGIGVTQEYQASKAQDKAGSSTTTSGPTHSGHLNPNDLPPEYHSDAEDEEYDAEDWELDEAQRNLSLDKTNADPLSSADEDGRDVDVLLDAFFNKHPTNPPRSGLKPLPCPVILPQRRPQMNTRGFIHAYAPVLHDSGIDQDTWMDFLNGFHKAVKMSPVFHAINASVGLAAMTATIVAGPSIIIHGTALALHISVEASRRGYTRVGTNRYLDAMNEKMFKPRGLYCMIMSYKPSSDNAAEEVDINGNTIKAVAKRIDGHGNKLSGSSGKTRSDLEMPQAAPLIFPELDKAPDDSNAFKKGGKFLTDYADRRAQAKWAAQNPHSSLNVLPEQQFHSKYSDPNHPANDGSLVALITGGKVGGRKARRARRRGEIEPATGAVKPRRGLLGTVKRSLQEDVLYLMVVNLPSDEELAQANENLKKVKVI